MRRILFILLCVFAVEARAQVQGEGFAAGSNLSGQACRVNENQTALATEGEANFCSVDTKGNQFVVSTDSVSGLEQSVIPVSNATGLNGVGAVGVGAAFIGVDAVEAASTTTVLNLTSHVARVGDILSFRTGTAANVGVWSTVSAVTANTVTLAYALPATPAASDAIHILRPQPLSVNPNNGNSIYNSLNVAIDSNTQVAAASGLLKLEDSVHASGDAGVFSLGVSNLDLGGALCSGSGDYCPIATNINGAVYTNLAVSNNAISPVRSEDVLSASGDALVAIGMEARSTLATTEEDGDYVLPKADLLGRTITTLAPAGESWQACTGAITNTTQTDIKAAVASNRIYVTSIGCNNTAAVASTLVFGDGASAIWQGAIGNSTLNGVAGYTTTFPVPLRGTSNTAFTVTLGTTATNTRCCAAGYISVN